MTALEAHEDAAVRQAREGLRVAEYLARDGRPVQATSGSRVEAPSP